MTVKELIELLKKEDEHRTVYVDIDSDVFGDVFDVYQSHDEVCLECRRDDFASN